MHCNPSQQNRCAAASRASLITSHRPSIIASVSVCNRLAHAMVERMRDTLMTYQELVDTGRGASLAPLELEERVLVKGKVKTKSPRPEPRKSRARALSRRFKREPSRMGLSRATSGMRLNRADSDAAVDVDSEDTRARAERKLGKKYTARR
eukprot:1906284-Prymnesium_polylepis.1